jgi:hypothetical protein
MDFTSGFSGIFTQPIQIDAVVIIRKETRLAIVATLDDMNWNIRQCESGAAWHGIALVNLSPEPSINRGLSPIFQRQCESGATWHGIALVNLSPEPSINRGLSPIFSPIFSINRGLSPIFLFSFFRLFLFSCVPYFPAAIFSFSAIFLKRKGRRSAPSFADSDYAEPCLLLS